MQLVYTTHHSILGIHALSPLVSWALVIGAGYGALRLVLDAVKLLDGTVGQPRPPKQPPPPITPRQPPQSPTQSGQ
jgi:hypothetical protein